MMARSNDSSSVLKDVVAYVDVWSSTKTANYSKPFIDQLLEMGAEVSKTFHKHVTHVVFKDGHQATWNKAKKIGAKLVSVLWVARCKDEVELADEELFPAQNDEANRLTKSRKHRCMQPKDADETALKNNRRMQKKLDKMIKDIAPQSPLFQDVSPYVINKQHGIVYSPLLKRSDSMAKRLKEMREKRENLSPTASQQTAASPLGVKPCLGFSPTIVKLLEDSSDEECSSPARSSHASPEEKGEASGHEVTNPHWPAVKPWLSPCAGVPRRSEVRSRETSGGGSREQGTLHQIWRRTSMKNELLQRGSEVPRQDPIKELPENPKAPKLRQSKLKWDSCGVNDGYLPDDAKPKTKPATSSRRHTITSPGDVTAPSGPAPAVTGNTPANQELGLPFQLTKVDPPTPKKKRTASSSASGRKSSLPRDSPSVAPSVRVAEEEYEDYFSPANQHPVQKTASLSFPAGQSSIQLPFQLGPAPGKRNSRRSETSVPQSKRSRPNATQSSPVTPDHPFGDVRDCHPVTHPRPHLPDPVPSVTVGPTGGPARPPRAKTRPAPPGSDADDFETPVGSHRIRSNPAKPPQFGPLRGGASWGRLEQSEGQVSPQAVESGGSEATVAACLAESTSEEGTSLKKMEQTKATRTLVMTSMSTDKQQTVTQVVGLLAGFSVVDHVCETTTHLVSGGHRRTVNVLLAIARGCWVLSFEWILRSLEQRRWLPEEPYELSEHFPAAAICRLQQHLSAGEHQQDLFRGQPAMFVSQQTQPPARSLVELIQLCGGTVCKSVRQAGLCVGHYKGRKPEGSRSVSEQWVLDCITQLKPLSYENYNLE